MKIRQRPAAMVTGWLGLTVVLGCIAGSVIAVEDQAGGWIALPIIGFVVALSGLVIVPPGQSGSYSSSIPTSAPSADPGCGGCRR